MPNPQEGLFTYISLLKVLMSSERSAPTKKEPVFTPTARWLKKQSEKKPLLSVNGCYIISKNRKQWILLWEEVPALWWARLLTKEEMTIMSALMAVPGAVAALRKESGRIIALQRRLHEIIVVQGKDITRPFEKA